MNNEDKINELEQRIEKLEKIEKRRKIITIISVCIYGVFIVAMIIAMSIFYSKIKPYKDQIDSLLNYGNNLKSDNIIDGTDEYGDLFNYFFNY